MSDNTRYPAILFISNVIRFFAWCSLILTVLGMIFVLASGMRDGMTAIIAFIGVGVFGGFLTSLFLVVFTASNLMCFLSQQDMCIVIFDHLHTSSHMLR